MAFDIVVWVSFGAVLSLFALWFSHRMGVHWVEALIIGTGGAFFGGLLMQWARIDGPKIGGVDLLSLIAAVGGSAILLTVYWLVRYRRRHKFRGHGAEPREKRDASAKSESP